jgi:hypothetical protein
MKKNKHEKARRGTQGKDFPENSDGNGACRRDLKSELRSYRKVTEEEEEDALHVLGFRDKGSWEADQPVCPRSVGKASCLYARTRKFAAPRLFFFFFFL